MKLMLASALLVLVLGNTACTAGDAAPSATLADASTAATTNHTPVTAAPGSLSGDSAAPGNHAPTDTAHTTTTHPGSTDSNHQLGDTVDPATGKVVPRTTTQQDPNVKDDKSPSQQNQKSAAE